MINPGQKPGETSSSGSGAPPPTELCQSMEELQILFTRFKMYYLPELEALYSDCTWLVKRLGLSVKKDMHKNEARLMQFTFLVDAVINQIKRYKVANGVRDCGQSLLRIEKKIKNDILPLKKRLKTRMDESNMRKDPSMIRTASMATRVQPPQQLGNPTHLMMTGSSTPSVALFLDKSTESLLGDGGPPPVMHNSDPFFNDEYVPAGNNSGAPQDSSSSSSIATQQLKYRENNNSNGTGGMSAAQQSHEFEGMRGAQAGMYSYNDMGSNRRVNSGKGANGGPDVSYRGAADMPGGRRMFGGELKGVGPGGGPLMEDEYVSQRRKRRLNEIVPNPRKARCAVYICSQCNEQYQEMVVENPWWVVAYQRCHKCNARQIPRIDIMAESNAIEHDPNVQALYGEGLEDSGDEQSLEGEDMGGDGYINGGYEMMDAQNEELFGSNADGYLEREEASKLLVLMCHARTCTGVHNNAKHSEICKSTKFLMLHIRDCSGTDIHGRTCKFPWCLPCKRMLHHLTHCYEPVTCSVCTPWSLPQSYVALKSVNEERMDGHPSNGANMDSGNNGKVPVLCQETIQNNTGGLQKLQQQQQDEMAQLQQQHKQQIHHHHQQQQQQQAHEYMHVQSLQKQLQKPLP